MYLIALVGQKSENNPLYLNIKQFLPFTTFHNYKMDVLKRNNVQVSGKGEKAMVFAHGYGCDQNMWRFITPAFEDEYKIVLFDHVGNGKSDATAITK